ncbi:MAG: bifunctional aconitate hydratase 2/2-methylisocitrate dehydratase, partial [Sulfurovum sp.]
MALIEEYKAHTAERAELGVPPLPLTAEQVAELVELLKAETIEEEEYLVDLLKNKVPAGVDDAAYVKAAFLNALVHEDAHSHAIDRIEAVKILGAMLGGYNVGPLIDGLRNNNVAIAQEAADQLKNTILIYGDFEIVKELMDHGNPFAKQVIESWA